MISYRHHSPNKLSGGQKQRVAIAGVIAMEPKCIVLDEPTAMLDDGEKRSFKNSAEVKRAEESYGYTDHTLYGRSGRCRQDLCYGSRACSDGRNTERIFSQVDTLKYYRLDVPQVTILADELKKRGLDIPDGILTKEDWWRHYVN